MNHRSVLVRVLGQDTGDRPERVDQFGRRLPVARERAEDGDERLGRRDPRTGLPSVDGGSVEAGAFGELGQVQVVADPQLAEPRAERGGR